MNYFDDLAPKSCLNDVCVWFCAFNFAQSSLKLNLCFLGLFLVVLCVFHQIQEKKTCLTFSVSGPCLWAWVFRLRDPIHLFNKAMFGEFGFYQRKNAFLFVLKACLPNTTLRYFFSLWFLVNSVFGKYTLLFSRNVYFLIFCAFAKHTLNNF